MKIFFLTKWVFIFLALCISLSLYAKEPEYLLKERKVIKSPYITENRDLNKEFDLFIAQGSSIYSGGLIIQLDKMVIMCVSQKNKCIGDQFFFYFKATYKNQEKNFILNTNEPQNMIFSDIDVKENLEEHLFGYKVSLLDLNFGIDRNSVRMVVSKAPE